MAAHGRAAAVGQLEPPPMERTDDLAPLDPAQPQRRAGVGTSPGEPHHRVAGPEDRQAQPGGLPHHAPAVTDLIQPANRDPLGHGTTTPTPNRTETGKTKSLGLASEAAPPVDST